MSQRLIFALLMSLVLSFLMTFFVTWLNLGFVPDFVARWMTAFRIGWPCAAVISFLFGPMILRLSLRLDALVPARQMRGR
ncbi:DUF2798 domain-containing protein [Mangrovicoccus algicola]|uniref:DUF2798 domain-containing protein n=1 Tax=Mangrovicoccus algicola TaxID=2771008 RepID=A0A8J6YU56_9RHOB|nr:DUF2798 domain-containing protein [Mangrovicoccus algicola]MBE3637750.1 DUF2798 domain-containing protein [Mangrovicoccus algicola]